jgi:hypothetical protein
VRVRMYPCYLPIIHMGTDRGSLTELAWLTS